MDCVTVRGLSFSYPGQDGPVLRDVSFSLEKGEFAVLCGPSGCGKSTLLRQLKSVLAPHGDLQGEILFEGRPLQEVEAREQAAAIGFVQQSPDNQIVTDKVWHELAFGLENLGVDRQTMRSRIAEMAAFFGIEPWFHREVSHLSGGQKQTLSLAAVMLLQPRLLLLDESTSQLDLVAASAFLTTLSRLNRELGVTVLLVEQRLEEALPLCDRVLLLDKGRLAAQGSPDAVGKALCRDAHGMFEAMPTAMRVWAAADGQAPCPVTVREGRAWLAARAQRGLVGTVPCPGAALAPKPEPALRFDRVWFGYDKKAEPLLRELSLTVPRGQVLALMGGNGAGKSTLLWLAAGLYAPFSGKVTASGKVGLLPQQVQSMFLKKTVEEDLFEALPSGKDAQGQARETLFAQEIAPVAARCGLEGLLYRHPFDLSGGEQQRAALAKVLLQQPDILLLDEPTKGMDAGFKREFAALLRELCAQGATVLMVSHDVEFCAQHADTCALVFDGGIAAQAPARDFLAANSFYTTAASRMSRAIVPGAVTAQDLISACAQQGKPAPAPATDAAPPGAQPACVHAAGPCEGAPAQGEFALRQAAPGSGQGLPRQEGCGRADRLPKDGPAQKADKKALHRSGRPKARAGRQAAVAGAALALVLATLCLGTLVFEVRSYYLLSLLVLLEIMLPFALLFEGRRPQARELVVVAVLCALGVAGRAAFFMLPQCKPVMALVILSGAALGAQTGFLVGALTMLLSNFLFGQGPWTPWQMVAMGLVGFLAGALFHSGLLRRTRGALCAFGALAAIFLYGALMSAQSALLWMQGLNVGILISYLLAGLPMDAVQAAATVVFLWCFSGPVLEKLERMKLKYGLLE